MERCPLEEERWEGGEARCPLDARSAPVPREVALAEPPPWRAAAPSRLPPWRDPLWRFCLDDVVDGVRAWRFCAAAPESPRDCALAVPWLTRFDPPFAPFCAATREFW